MKKPDCSSGPSGDHNRAEVKARWNPYWVGIGIGGLNWFAFGLGNQPLGISTALPILGSNGGFPWDARRRGALRSEPYL